MPRAPFPILASFLLIAGMRTAAAHPHVFVEPHIEVTASRDGHLESLRNVWHFDEMFSASVVVDFDANGDGRLEKDELAAIGKQVRGSIERWGFYTDVHAGASAVKMVAPATLGVSWDTKAAKLVFDFAMRPEAPVDLKAGDVSFSNFDDTYFTAFDFKDMRNLTVRNMPHGCRAEMNAPTPDEAAKSWMATISAIPADSDVPADGIKFSDALSTKYRIRCGGK
ncbi:DUF1007 family protein [Aureimonas leprariae]|uniref:DUF1007 family protein n=1 Tax=Plantimonas leprariae TaxID=2615207 RepID=A0A7V7PR61_9HYPH|nr:DUF1007 family protein [Aureimonas leprariae]KAB0680929.1 DUF1007 family protein [Aureimonas leprariae]